MSFIPLSEVIKHNTARSTWVVINSQVYDLTKFLSEHPGGEQSILNVAGTDGTVAFEDVGHSTDARELMKKYKIGSLLKEGHKCDACRVILPYRSIVSVSSGRWPFFAEYLPHKSAVSLDRKDIAKPNWLNPRCQGVPPIKSSKSSKSSMSDKSWRTYDGSTSGSTVVTSRSSKNIQFSSPPASPRVKSIIVPLDSNRSCRRKKSGRRQSWIKVSQRPDLKDKSIEQLYNNPYSKYLWLLLLLAAGVVTAIVIKKKSSG